MDPMPAETIALARRHLSMRCFGIPLFLLGALGLGTASVLLVLDRVSWHLVLWYFGATALSLATFGNHSDTGIAFLVRAEPSELTPKMRSELREELDRDRAATLALRPTPIAAATLTLMAIVFHILSARKLMGEWM